MSVYLLEISGSIMMDRCWLLFLVTFISTYRFFILYFVQSRNAPTEVWLNGKSNALLYRYCLGIFHSVLFDLCSSKNKFGTEK